MVSFNAIPNALRIPFCTVEFDGSMAQQGPALLAYRALLIGQKIAGGIGASNSLQKVTNADQVAVLAGRGSILHRMAKVWFANNSFTETWIGILDDASVAVRATGTITTTGPATAAGTIDLYIGGQHVQVGVASGDSAATIAAAIATAIGKHASGTVTCSSATTGSDVTVAGVTFVATAGAVSLGEAKYSKDTGNTEAAASLAAQINGHVTAGAAVYAIASGAVVTIWALACGTAGNAIALTTADAVHTAVSGTGTLAGATVASDLGAHAASVAGGVITLHACNKGACGNDLDLRHSYQDGEALPAGTGVACSAMSAGTTNPTLTALIAAMGDRWFHVLAHPYTDATSLTALEAELASRAGPMRMIDGLAITSASGSQSTLGTLGGTRNSQFNCIVAQPGAHPLIPPCEYAAMVAAVVAYYANIDPARPLQTLPVIGALPPAEADLFTNTERNLLLFDGIATTRAGAGGVVQLERIITTWQRNAAGSADTAYLDATRVLTLQYLRYSFRARMMARYPRHKLGKDGTRYGAGQAIITPLLGKAEAVAWFEEAEGLALVQDLAQFKRDLVVEQNALDPNRLDFLLPPELIDQLIVTAAQIQFRG